MVAAEREKALVATELNATRVGAKAEVTANMVVVTKVVAFIFLLNCVMTASI